MENSQLKLAIVERIMNIEDPELLAALLKIIQNASTQSSIQKDAFSTMINAPFTLESSSNASNKLTEEAQELQQSIDEVFNS